MNTFLKIAGGALIGYVFAYWLARGRGEPGAVSLLNPTYATLLPGTSIMVLNVGGLPVGFSPDPVIAVQQPQAPAVVKQIAG